MSVAQQSVTKYRVTLAVLRLVGFFTRVCARARARVRAYIATAFKFQGYRVTQYLIYYFSFLKRKKNKGESTILSRKCAVTFL